MIERASGRHFEVSADDMRSIYTLYLGRKKYRCRLYKLNVVDIESYHLKVKIIRRQKNLRVFLAVLMLRFSWNTFLRMGNAPFLKQGTYDLLIIFIL